MSTVSNEWPLWEVFVRSRGGLSHRHGHPADLEELGERDRHHDDVGELRGDRVVAGGLLQR